MATGAVLTDALFILGKYLISLYLGYSGVRSAFGATGSVVAFLVWIDYSTQILLFGAEVTKVVAERAGRRIAPAPGRRPSPAPTRRSSALEDFASLIPKAAIHSDRATSPGDGCRCQDVIPKFAEGWPR